MDRGLVFDIKRFAVHDGKGIRSTVFLKGCPLRCAWCHNPEGLVNKRRIWRVNNRCIGCGACVEVCSQKALTRSKDTIVFDPSLCISDGTCAKVCTTGALRWDSELMTVDEVMDVIRRDSVAYEKSGGGVTVSGGEPMSEQAEFALAILKACKDEGLKTAVESSLFTPNDTMRRFEEVVDDFICDIKVIDPARHKEATGVDNSLILDNIKDLSTRRSILLRTPMIPGYTSDEENIKSIGEFVGALPNMKTHIKMELLNFNPLFTQKYHYREEEPVCPPGERFSEEEMERRRNILKGYGIEVIH